MVLPFAIGYTLPLAIVDIVAALLLIGWGLGL
jgi:hypothetical protein